MTDLLILEITIGALLFISVFRAFIRSFRGIDGISVLPGVAFVLCLGSFPAFGFRPELLPLTVVSFISAIWTLPRFLDLARKLSVDDYGERNMVVAFLKCAAVILCVVFAVVFQPKKEAIRQEQALFSESISVRDEARGAVLLLRVLRPETAAGVAARLPTVVIVPPVLGSSEIINGYRTALASRGLFTVTVTRPGFDVPSRTATGDIVIPSVDRMKRAVASLLWCRTWAFAAEWGAEIERERAADLAFVAGYIASAAASGDRKFSTADTEKLSFAGFGSGGSAALAASSALTSSGRPSAVVAVEPIFASAFLAANTAEPEPTRKIGPRRVSGLGSGAEGLPMTDVPVLLLLSDRIQRVSERDSRYAATIRLLRSIKSACLAVSFGGAGPVAYSDAPVKYPVYQFFSRPFMSASGPAVDYPASAGEATADFVLGSYGALEALPGIMVEKNE